MEATFKSVVDVDARISEHRELLASQRCERPDPASISTSRVVLESVVEMMVKQMCPLFEELRLIRETEKTAAGCQTEGIRADLARMSLVHPSWTYIAQRGLRRRIVIRNPEHLQRLVHSSLCGPWVLEFGYSYDQHLDGDEEYDGEAFEQRHVGFLASLLTRFSNLRFIGLVIHASFSTNGCTTSLTPPYGLYWDRLALWKASGSKTQMMKIDGSCFYVSDAFCDALSRLNNLKLLSISTESGRGRITETESPAPPASLTSLSFHLPLVNGSLQILDWLIRPRGTFAVKNLFVTDIFDDETYWRFEQFADSLRLSGCLPRLETILLSGMDWEGESFGESLQLILADCLSLKTLYLGTALAYSSSQFSSRRLPLALPHSLENISVTLNYGSEPPKSFINGIDASLQALLAANSLPNLQHVLVDDSYSIVPILVDLSNRLPLSMQYCEESKWVFRRGSCFQPENYILRIFKNTESGWTIR